MNNSCYYFNKGKVIDFKIPYYINFLAGDKNAYGLCLHDEYSESYVEKIIFTCFVSSSINAIIRFEGDNNKKEEIYLCLKQSLHKYVLLNPFTGNVKIKQIILYIPYINNMTLSETKLLIPGILLK